MTLRQLELFIAIAETQSFSRGADTCFITQSTASQHIAALEEEVNTQLFDRTSKGVVLTPGGEVFLSHARRILTEYRALFEGIQAFHGLESASLVFGASTIPANFLVPKLLPLIKQMHPGIMLDMRIGDTRQVTDLLVSEQIELAIIGAQMEPEKVNYQPLIKDRLVLIVGADSPLKDHEKITLKELKDLPLIVRGSGSGTLHTLENRIYSAGLSQEALNIVARIGGNEAILSAVAAGCGCAFVSDLSIQKGLERGELFKLEIDGLSIERQLWLATLKGRTSSPAAKAVSELLIRMQGHIEANSALSQ